MNAPHGTDANKLTALAGAGLVLLTTGAIIAASVVARMPKLDLSGGAQVVQPTLSSPGAIALPGEPAAPEGNDTRSQEAPAADSSTGDLVAAVAIPRSGAEDDALRRAAARGDARDRETVDSKVDRGADLDRVAARTKAHGPFAPNGLNGGDGAEGSTPLGHGKKLGHYKEHKAHKGPKVKVAKSHPVHPSKVHGKPDDDDEAEGSGDEHDGSKSKGDDTASGHSKDSGDGND